MLLTPGQVLLDRYRVIGLLGQGGMAAVYCAHDRALDRLAAIKQLQPDPIASETALQQAREQFLREAQVLATLDHPNLPRVTDYFTRDSIEYLVMDYVEGQSLIEVVQKNGVGLGDDRVLDWADQLLSALEYIHRYGMIHRDVKPANIRLTPDGRIFLVDFGLVKMFDPANPKTATIMHGLGTPEYAPPEQYDSRLGHTDPRSDVYALGATLYHLLTGQAPATATQRISDPDAFRRPRALGAHISADVERTILRAMELQRTRRFDNATEMRAALKLARRTPVEGGLTQRLPRWAFQERRFLTRRVVPLLAFVLLVFVLLVVGRVIVLNGGDQLSPTPPIAAIIESIPSQAPSSATATPTPSPTPTATPTPTFTFTPTAPGTTSPSPTATRRSPTPTATRTNTATPTLIPTRERTETPTATRTPTPITPTITPTPSNTPTATIRDTPGP